LTRPARTDEDHAGILVAAGLTLQMEMAHPTKTNEHKEDIGTERAIEVIEMGKAETVVATKMELEDETVVAVMFQIDLQKIPRPDNVTINHLHLWLHRGEVLVATVPTRMLRQPTTRRHLDLLPRDLLTTTEEGGEDISLDLGLGLGLGL